MIKLQLQQYDGDSSSGFYQNVSSELTESGPINNGKWTEEENVRYSVFVEYFQRKIGSKVKRRTNKVFKHMSRFIPSRNAIQCRSHHQKMQRRFGDLKSIINFFKSHTTQGEYLRYYNELTKKTQSFQKPETDAYGNIRKTFKEVSIQTDREMEPYQPIRCSSCEATLTPVNQQQQHAAKQEQQQQHEQHIPKVEQQHGNHHWYFQYPYHPFNMQMEQYM